MLRASGSKSQVLWDTKLVQLIWLLSCSQAAQNNNIAICTSKYATILKTSELRSNCDSDGRHTTHTVSSLTLLTTKNNAYDAPGCFDALRP